MKRSNKMALLAAMALLAVACGGGGGAGTTAGGPAAGADHGSVDPIKLVANTWLGSEANIAIAKNILENELGYKVEVTVVDENAMWPAIAAGDVHAALEVWPSGHAENVANFIEADAGVVNLGELGVLGKISWYVPTYVVDEHPELATWEGFKDPELAALFATAETGDKGQFLAGDPAYVQFDTEIIENLELPLQVVVGGSEEALLSALDAAYAAKDPVLFYFWTPHSALAKYDLTPVALPEYTDECGQHASDQDGGVDCDYPGDVLFKIAWEGLEEGAPDAFTVLSNMSYTNEDQIEILAAVDGGKTVDEAAADWLTAHADTWNAWLP